MSQVDVLLDCFHSASSLTVVCHDDPDPDCLAGAMALKLLASESGIDTVDILYGGTISHQQNRAFVNVFDIELQQYSEELREANELVAFVDHSLPGNHNSVPAETAVDIVIDHHPTDHPIPAEFVDIREEYGATATILTEYIRESPIEMTTRIASGLLFGIHRDCLDFIRQPTTHEYGAGEYLDPRADIEMLRELYGASFTAATVDVVGDAIQNRVKRNACLVSCIGRTAGHDALTQAADYLLNIEGVSVVLVCGIVDDEVQLSARSIRKDIDLGERLREAYGDIGQAGGHKTMAGGQLSLGRLNDVTHEESEVVEMINKRVRRRFFDVMGVAADENGAGV
ncbi:bifunctional oligoribonuclease/PAP phosphatase NrnA [Halorubrum sp. CBA1125]|nr:bifunctional oligoribonuclease/PAP phosphatase NrnA [Halorubrum sp. CBA1125]